VRAHLVSFLVGNRDGSRFWPPLSSGESRKERGENQWKSDQQRHEEKQVDKCYVLHIGNVEPGSSEW
jgi:hypothetical protein